MRPVIYFDHAATSWPKPRSVLLAMQNAVQYAGGNPGRGGHPLAQRAGSVVFHARETAARLFGAQPENVVFTSNCTHALNLAIYGVLRPGDHVLISALEHNAVLRPIAALAAAGCIRYTAVQVSPETEKTIEAFAQAIEPATRAVICTAVSNVTGQILPYREIAALCRARGLVCIVDGAQACGVLPIGLADGMQLLCCPGHKGLCGVTGTGMLLSDGSLSLRPLMQGGTGSLSALEAMPDFLPDALEPGTVNVPGIAALDAGMQWVMRQPREAILAHESALCGRFLRGLARLPGAAVYREPCGEYAPVVSFRLADETPDDTAARLGARGFCLRAGLHCAPLAHRQLGTPEGTVRFSPGRMNTPAEVDMLLQALRAQK